MIRWLAEKVAAKSGMAFPKARRIVGWVTAFVVLVLAAVAVWALWPHVPGKVWIALLVILGVAGLAWLVFRGIPRYMEHRFIQKHSGDLSPGNASDEQAPIQRMQQRLEEAQAIWERSPEFSSVKQPLYWMPFYLVLGDKASDQETLLRSAATSSPMSAPQRAGRGDKEWLVWWFHKDAVALETSADFPCDQGDRVTRGIWYQALQLLKSARPKQPLNGFLLLVSASSLLDDAAAIREYGQRLRRLVDEAMAQLQIVAPVYVVVTGIDRLPGGEAFVQCLPKESANQLVGHVFGEPKTGQEAAQQARTVFSEIEARLQALCLGVLARDGDLTAKALVFDYVAQFRRLSGGLDAFAQALFEENVLQRKVAWRGLAFTSSSTQKSFVNDLFLRFLPADQPLAARSGQRRLLGWVGVAAVVGFAALLAAGTIWWTAGESANDKAAIAAAETECGPVEQSGGSLAAFERCRAGIMALEDYNSKKSLSLGFGASESAARDLQARFSASFEKQVLAKVDAALDSAAGQKKSAFLVQASRAQLLWLIDTCRKASAECISPADIVPVAASTADFPELGTPEPDEVAAKVLQAFVRWVPEAALSTRKQLAEDQLRNAVKLAPPTIGDADAWGSVRLPPFSARHVWKPDAAPERPRPEVPEPQQPAPSNSGRGSDDLAELLGAAGITVRENRRSPSDGAAPAQPAPVAAPENVSGVPGTYRIRIARSVVEPLVTQLSRVVPESAAGMKQFGEDYARNYYGAWARLLAQFQEGIDVWRGATGELARQMTDTETPFTRLFAQVDANVGAWKQGWMPQPSWVTAIEATRAAQGKAVDAAARDLIRSIISDTSGRDSYDLARGVFAATPAPDAPPAVKALLKAVADSEKPSTEDQKRLAPGDYGPWSVTQGPLRTAVFLLAYRAVEFQEETWKREVASGMAGKSGKEQALYLLGPEGRLKGFWDTWLKSFYRADGLPVSVAGVTLPLHPDFQAYVRQTVLGAEGGGSGPVPAGTLQVYPSSLGGLSEGPAGTSFELMCQTQKFSASSKGMTIAETRATVFWSPRGCLDAVIKISLPPKPEDPTTPAAAPAGVPPPSLFLVKTYPGADGFISLIKDFKNGPKAFRLADFEASYAPAQWKALQQELSALRISGARVNLKIELSPEMGVYVSGPRPLPPTLLPPRLG